MAKVDIVHVPYKGVAPGVIDLLGGQVQMMFAIMQSAPAARESRQAEGARGLRREALVLGARAAHDLRIRCSRLRIHFVERRSRSRRHAPCRSSRAIHGEVVKVLALPDVKERMFGLGLEVTGSTPEQLGDAGQIGHREVEQVSGKRASRRKKQASKD